MLGFLKYCLIIAVILVLSQIPVDGVRICDHVGNILPISAIKDFTKKISNAIDYKETGKGKLSDGKPAHDSVSEPEKAVLSGLLKTKHE